MRQQYLLAIDTSGCHPGTAPGSDEACAAISVGLLVGILSNGAPDAQPHSLIILLYEYSTAVHPAAGAGAEMHLV
jgi:hypothetical protein